MLLCTKIYLKMFWKVAFCFGLYVLKLLPCYSSSPLIWSHGTPTQYVSFSWRISLSEMPDNIIPQWACNGRFYEKILLRRYIRWQGNILIPFRDWVVIPEIIPTEICHDSTVFTSSMFTCIVKTHGKVPYCISMAGKCCSILRLIHLRHFACMQHFI